jgi:hypothetical protein
VEVRGREFTPRRRQPSSDVPLRFAAVRLPPSRLAPARRTAQRFTFDRSAPRRSKLRNATAWVGHAAVATRWSRPIAAESQVSAVS